MLGKRRARTFRKYSARKRRATEFNRVIAPALGFGKPPYGKGYQPVVTNDGDTPELKWHDTGLDSTVFDTDGTANSAPYYHVLSLNTMAQGDDGSQRNGNKIQVKRLNIRGQVIVDSNSGPANELLTTAVLFRVLVYVDTQPNGQGVAYSQLFETSPANQGQFYAYNKLSSTGRFKILMDKFILVPPSTAVYNPIQEDFDSFGNSKFFKMSVPLDLAIRFSDGTNNLAAVQKNNIGMFILADINNSARDQMRFNYRSRLRYKDN